MRARAALLAVALAGCGGAGGPAGPRGGDDPFADVERDRTAAARAPVRAAPRWEPVAVLRGAGGPAARRSLEVADRAIQWRARWTCRAGALRATATAPDGRRARLLDERCPASGEATAVSTGRIALAVAADGPWRVRVDQQVDTPLREPPLAGTNPVARGRFASLDRRARGTASLARRRDGRLVLRLEDFVTAASADLFVWVAPGRRPRTSREALDAPHVELGPLKATAGDQNYVLPPQLGVEDVRSVVIWCEPVRIAYGAAGLRPG